MTADQRLLPAGIADDRSRALLELIDRLGGLDLEPILMNRIDSTAAQALVHLAYQFHVLGLEGYDLAGDEVARRQLVRQALALHRYKGTPWSVRVALGSAGYADVVVDEKVGTRRHNGRYRRNGEITYSGEGAGWAAFGVFIGDLADGHELTSAEQTLLSGVINEFKSARSRLQQLAFTQPADEALPALAESAHFTRYDYPVADGTYIADGSISAGGVPADLETLL